MQPEDVLDAAWLTTYRERLKALHNDLARAQTRLLVFRHIVEFPSSLFGWGGAETFWPVIRDALSETVIGGLWRLLVDDHRNALTIPRMRNDILRHAKDDASKKLIAAQLKSLAFRGCIKRLRDRLSHLRHSFVGHLSISGIGSGSATHISLKELQEVIQEAHDLINILGFGTYLELLPLEYNPHVIAPAGQDTRPDIEVILDRVVSESRALHMPEQQPAFFPYYWRERSARERKVFNLYRKKFGLPEVP